MTVETYLRCEREGPVAILVYDRPHRRHAWDAGMYRAIVAAITAANEDPAIGAILLTAEGPVFCAGADFKAMPEPPDPLTGIRHNVATLAMADGDSWLHLLAASKPVVAAVQGDAIGLGVTHILPADLRLCAETAHFSFPFLALGTMPEMGATALLPQLVGTGRALELCLTSARIDAMEAKRIGLIAQVVPDAGLRAAAIARATQLAALPPDALRITRRMFAQNRLESDSDTLLARERAGFDELRHALRAQRTAKPA